MPALSKERQVRLAVRKIYNLRVISCFQDTDLAWPRPPHRKFNNRLPAVASQRFKAAARGGVQT